MKGFLRVVCCLSMLLGPLTSFSQTTPDYTLRGNKLIRKDGTGYEVSVAPSLKFVGVKRFHIRQAADAEQHIFATADSSGRVERLVWVQFEQQLPGQNWQYDYPSPERIKLGDLEFISDWHAFLSYAGHPPGVDHAKMDDLLAEHKFRFDGPVIAIRMVHLPDKERRRELMIIYVESLPKSEETKFGVFDEDAAKWPKELAKLKANAMRDLQVRAMK